GGWRLPTAHSVCHEADTAHGKCLLRIEIKKAGEFSRLGKALTGQVRLRRSVCALEPCLSYCTAGQFQKETDHVYASEEAGPLSDGGRQLGLGRCCIGRP